MRGNQFGFDGVSRSQLQIMYKYGAITLAVGLAIVMGLIALLSFFL